eukprot:1140878-Pelagomonas_calceolata.AAC.3
MKARRPRASLLPPTVPLDPPQYSQENNNLHSNKPVKVITCVFTCPSAEGRAPMSSTPSTSGDSPSCPLPTPFTAQQRAPRASGSRLEDLLFSSGLCTSQYQQQGHSRWEDMGGHWDMGHGRTWEDIPGGQQGHSRWEDMGGHWDMGHRTWEDIPGGQQGHSRWAQVGSRDIPGGRTWEDIGTWDIGGHGRTFQVGSRDIPGGHNGHRRLVGVVVCIVVSLMHVGGIGGGDGGGRWWCWWEVVALVVECIMVLMS